MVLNKIYNRIVSLAFFFMATVTSQAQIGPGGVVTDLQLWLRADKNVTLSGTDVTGWKDSSIASYNFDDGAATRYPTYKDNGLNFNPAFTFVNGDEIINTESIELIPAGTQEISVFAVALPTTDQSVLLDARLNIASADGGWGFNRGGYYSGVKSLSLGLGDGVNRTTNTYSHTASNTHVNNIPNVFSATQGTSTADVLFYVNGLIQATTSVKTSGNLSYSGSDAITSIGRDNLGYDPNFEGDFAEVIVYKQKVSAIERQSIESYLAIKYGITLDQSIA